MKEDFASVPREDEVIVANKREEANTIVSTGPTAMPGPWLHSCGRPPFDVVMFMRETIPKRTDMGDAAWWDLSLPCHDSSQPILYSCPGALKSYLRELPEPLMTFELYDEWIQASK